jgi:AcrR family transcriptional regulator
MRTGRPREFDPNRALDRALEVFRRKGYQGASLPDLTRAMKINRPSLYAAFGNKESLFRQALDRYAAGPASYVRQALAQPTARQVIEQLLNGAYKSLTDPTHPPGCLMVQGALSCGQSADPIRRELISRRAILQSALTRRLTRARSQGDLPKAINPADLSRFIVTLIHGMSVQAAGGATRPQLRRVARMALSTWPNISRGKTRQ